MVRSRRGTGGVIAAVLAAMITGTGVVLVGTIAVDGVASLRTPSTAHADEAPIRQGNTVDRERKADALPVPVAKQARAEIKSIEVVGLRDASIVYRDRDGNILFRTDPLTNVTLVSKNVDLPQLTIRETIAKDVQRMEVERMDVEHAPAGKASPSGPPQGCESAFALPSPELLVRRPSRCLTWLTEPHEGVRRVAAGVSDARS